MGSTGPRLICVSIMTNHDFLWDASTHHALNTMKLGRGGLIPSHSLYGYNHIYMGFFVFVFVCFFVKVTHGGRFTILFKIG